MPEKLVALDRRKLRAAQLIAVAAAAATPLAALAGVVGLPPGRVVVRLRPGTEVGPATRELARELERFRALG